VPRAVTPTATAITPTPTTTTVPQGLPPRIPVRSTIDSLPGDHTTPETAQRRALSVSGTKADPTSAVAIASAISAIALSHASIDPAIS
jgi:hypothetical protein